MMLAKHRDVPMTAQSHGLARSERALEAGRQLGSAGLEGMTVYWPTRAQP